MEFLNMSEKVSDRRLLEVAWVVYTRNIIIIFDKGRGAVALKKSHSFLPKVYIINRNSYKI